MICSAKRTVVPVVGTTRVYPILAGKGSIWGAGHPDAPVPMHSGEDRGAPRRHGGSEGVHAQRCHAIWLYLRWKALAPLLEGGHHAVVSDTEGRHCSHAAGSLRAVWRHQPATGVCSEAPS